jgi:hypothetical protein
MSQITLPLGFTDPKYLLIYEETLHFVQEITEEIIMELRDQDVRIVDLENNQEIFWNLNEVQVGEIETLD